MVPIKFEQSKPWNKRKKSNHLWRRRTLHTFFDRLRINENDDKLHTHFPTGWEWMKTMTMNSTRIFRPVASPIRQPFCPLLALITSLVWILILFHLLLILLNLLIVLTLVALLLLLFLITIIGNLILVILLLQMFVFLLLWFDLSCGVCLFFCCFVWL